MKSKRLTSTLVKSEIEGCKVEVITSLRTPLSIIAIHSEHDYKTAPVVDVDLADVIRAVLTAETFDDLLVMVKDTWKYEMIKKIVETIRIGDFK